MDRLTKRNAFDYIVPVSFWDCNCREYCNEMTSCTECQIKDCFQKLADYEDLDMSPSEIATMIDDYGYLSAKAEEIQEQEADGLLVELPFKYGDKIYEAYEKLNKVLEWEVTGFNLTKDSMYIQIGRFGVSLNASKLGVTLFRTREEAEKKLEELKNA